MKKRRTTDSITRFRDKYIMRENGCWEWVAGMSHGYGSFRHDDKMIHAHVFAWFNANGRMPAKDMLICHTCNNRKCVNPDHLYEGTNADNQKDSVTAGTHYSSSRTHCPKGHAYDGDNLAINSRGARICKMCRSETDRKYYDRKNGGITRRTEKQ